MKQVSKEFKNQISKAGRIIKNQLTYTINDTQTIINDDNLYSIKYSNYSNILKTLMKQLEFKTKELLVEGTEINASFSLKVNNSFENINYGTYIVYKIEKREETNTYFYTCYDKMLKFMVDYEQLNVLYPITIKNFIIAICNKFEINFANINDTFVNYDKVIDHELFLTNNGGSLGYTFRDVLDQLAEVTASTICINENDELEIRYINDTESQNLYNYKDVTNPDSNFTIDENGWINLYYNNETDSNKYANYFVNVMNLEEDTEYSIIVEVQTLSNTGITLMQNRNDEQFVGNASISSSSQAGTYIFKRTTKSDYTNVLYGLRLFCNVSANSIAQARFRVSVLEDTNVNKDKFSYEMYDGDTIDEDYLKNVNVTFGEKFGPVNSIVLSRAGESDNIYLRDEQSITENGLCEIKIIENQIMNFNNRDEYLQEIFNQLNGLEYYINDFSSTGVCYYDICDKYYVKVADKFYKCIMFNDEINITQGLEENIYTEMPEESQTDYKKADKTDRKINQAYSIVDKQNIKIEDLTSRVTTLNTTTNNNYQELLTKFNDYTPQSDTIQIEQSVRQLQTDTYTKTEINTKLTDGSVTKVLTTAGTFDENGLTIEKTNAKSKGRFNEKGVTVLDATGSSDTELLFAGFDEDLNESIVRTRNLKVSKYLTIGQNSRIEDYEDGTGIFAL